jgi:hypothetical protein
MRAYRQAFTYGPIYKSDNTANTAYENYGVHLSEYNESYLSRRLISWGLRDERVCTTDISYRENTFPTKNLQESSILLEIYNALKEYEHQKKERILTNISHDKMTSKRYFIIALVAKTT